MHAIACRYPKIRAPCKSARGDRSRPPALSCLHALEENMMEGALMHASVCMHTPACKHITKPLTSRTTQIHRMGALRSSSTELWSACRPGHESPVNTSLGCRGMQAQNQCRKRLQRTPCPTWAMKWRFKRQKQMVLEGFGRPRPNPGGHARTHSMHTAHVHKEVWEAIETTVVHMSAQQGWAPSKPRRTCMDT